MAKEKGRNWGNVERGHPELSVNRGGAGRGAGKRCTNERREYRKTATCKSDVGQEFSTQKVIPSSQAYPGMAASR